MTIDSCVSQSPIWRDSCATSLKDPTHLFSPGMEMPIRVSSVLVLTVPVLSVPVLTVPVLTVLVLSVPDLTVPALSIKVLTVPVCLSRF